MSQWNTNGHLADQQLHSDLLKASRFQSAPQGLPDVLDLGDWLAPQMFQSAAGTCDIHSCISAARYDLISNDEPDVALSRLQLYYDVRKLMGMLGQDSGAYTHDVVACMRDIGVGREELWPYDLTRLNDVPPPEVYDDAPNHRATDITAIGMDDVAMRIALWRGKPVVIGVNLYKQFESDEAAATGIITMPPAGATPIGGHSMLLFAIGEYQLCQNWWNDWGGTWKGKPGMARLPRGYIEQEGTDNWVVESSGRASVA